MTGARLRFLGFLTMVGLATAACGSSSKPNTTTTTTVASSTTSSSTPSVVTDTFPTTTTTPGVQSPEDLAKAFFAAWQANNTTVMNADGSNAAVTAALAARPSGTSGYVFSNCQGAAGSTYCTWVKRGSSIVVQVQNQPPVKVVGFQHNTLSAQDTANEFFTGYQMNNAAVVTALADAATSAKTAALESHRTLPWVPPQNCDGAAGSLYCTWTAGSSKFVVRVVQVNPPPQVGDVTYTA
jgi:hypothetical protein